MNELIQPERFFVERYGLGRNQLEELLGGAVGRKADYGDLYFEYRIFDSLGLEDGRVARAAREIRQGVGLRVVAQDRTGYAHSDEVTFENLKLAAKAAACIAEEGGDRTPLPIGASRPAPHDLYPVPAPPTQAPLGDRVELLSRIDRKARAADSRIKNVIASLTIEHRAVMIVRSDGAIVSDARPLTRLSVTCIAERAGRREQGTHGGGGRAGIECLLAENRYLAFTEQAVRQALVNLEADEAPAGEMTVVLASGWPGILLHEAVGHGLEGDFNRKGVSAFSQMMGERVACELCTVVDDGTLPGRRGSLNVDDEGTPTSRTILIEHGVLRGYLQDRMNAALMGLPLTGNGRRESFAHIPMPRMTNTFMLPGEATPEEIIRSVDRGLYAVAFGGGQVDITNGKFVFSASEAYLIEGGRVTRPVRGATLIGNGPQVLRRVSMVGNDLRLDDGVGTCGKDGQSVPVGVGLPTIRVDGITVGGTRV